MPIWDYVFLFFSVIIGGGIGLLIKKESDFIFKLLIPFTGAYILGITVLHLMPVVYASGSHEVGLFVLLGFFIQIFLEQFSGGVEHGHIHTPNQPNLVKLLPLFFGLGLHAYLEGFPLSVYPELHETLHEGEDSHNHLLLGVILHKAPAAFALTSILSLTQFNRFLIWVVLTFFALMSPLGAITAYFIQPNPDLIIFFTAVIIGLFLHVSTTTIFEADDKRQHRISWKKIGAIVGGVALALLTLL